MAGCQKRLNESVQARLSFALSLTLLIFALLAGGLSFFSAVDEAHELQDDVLRQAASLVDGNTASPRAPATDANGIRKHHDEKVRLVVQGLGTHPLAGARGHPLPLPESLADGLHTLSFDGEAFRVLVKTTATGERVAIVQNASFRDEIARDSALRTVMPLLLLIPLLPLLTIALVRGMFRPIAALAQEVDRRGGQDLHPVATDAVPAEVRPFVAAINRLLARVTETLAAQRRFVADAAHELRSPLTVLSLQAARLADTEMPAPARARLETLRHGIERSGQLLHQLLDLTRAQSMHTPPASPVSAQAVFREVLETLMPLAEARHIDVGVEGTEDFWLAVDALDIHLLLRNLLDNAIRYTPAGGRVDLSIHALDDCIALRVTDSGPGIPVDERQRVFAPFHRILGSEQPGSGLGLAIVKAIVDRLGATIRLDYANEEQQTGLRVSVLLPLSLARPAP